jgi:hypothetical protein
VICAAAALAAIMLDTLSSLQPQVASPPLRTTFTSSQAVCGYYAPGIQWSKVIVLEAWSTPHASALSALELLYTSHPSSRNLGNLRAKVGLNLMKLGLVYWILIGLDCTGRLFISDRAHLVFDFHQIVDGLKEEELGGKRWIFLFLLLESLPLIFRGVLAPRRKALVQHTQRKHPDPVFECIIFSTMKYLPRNFAKLSRTDSNATVISYMIRRRRFSATR